MSTGNVMLHELFGLIESEIAWLIDHGQMDQARHLLDKIQAIRAKALERSDRVLGLNEIADRYAQQLRRDLDNRN